MASSSLMDASDRIPLPSSSPEATEPMAASQDQALVHCPRCDSTHTKFCYYNNYSRTQPRHFCKSCRRYWTKGGTLRNIPVGGVCRKNKKLSSTSRKPTTPHLHRQQSPDGNRNGISPNSNSPQPSYPESPAQFSVYPNFMESSGGGGGEYDGAIATPFPATVASGGYGAGTGNAYGLSLFGEVELFENMMNGVDVKSRVYALEWQELTGCHSDIYGSGDERNGPSGYLTGLGSYGLG